MGRRQCRGPSGRGHLASRGGSPSHREPSPSYVESRGRRRRSLSPRPRPTLAAARSCALAVLWPPLVQVWGVGLGDRTGSHTRPGGPGSPETHLPARHSRLWSSPSPTGGDRGLQRCPERGAPRYQGLTFPRAAPHPHDDLTDEADGARRGRAPAKGPDEGLDWSQCARHPGVPDDAKAASGEASGLGPGLGVPAPVQTPGPRPVPSAGGGLDEHVRPSGDAR